MPPSEPTIFSGPSLILTPNIGRSAKIFDDFICKSFKNWICNIILICPICTWVSPDELDYPNCAIRCFVDLQCCGWWKLPSCAAAAIKVGLIGQISIFFVNITLHWWHFSYHLLGLTIAFRWSVFVSNSLNCFPSSVKIVISLVLCQFHIWYVDYFQLTVGICRQICSQV